MAAEAALVAEELGKIVSAQQIFVLRKAIYRLTAQSAKKDIAFLCNIADAIRICALRQRPPTAKGKCKLYDAIRICALQQ